MPGHIVSRGPARQIGMCRPQLAAEIGMLFGALLRQIEQRLQPEVSDVEDLHALLHKADGQ